MTKETKEQPAKRLVGEVVAEEAARNKLICLIEQWDGESEYDAEDVAALADDILHAFNGPPTPAPEGGAVLADACRTAARSYAETNDDYMVEMLLKAATALATREDAQPVACLDAAQKKAAERAAMDAGAYSWRNARLAMVDGDKVIGYPAFSRADMAELARLHTHPAPDALQAGGLKNRTALQDELDHLSDQFTDLYGVAEKLREALDPFARIASEGVIHTSEGHVTVTTCAEYFHAAVKALAALQAEQKGGAA